MYRNRLKNPRAFLRLAVDVNSNTVMITKANPVYAPFQEQKTLPLSEPWGKALVDGTLSDDLLGNVIHELTHHASLQTPVGNSLSTLALSHTSDVISTIKDADLMVGPARDTIRYEIANAYLQPLLEGLALFAEFDALPSDMPLSTWSNMVSLRLFCSQEIGKAFHAGNHPFSALKTKLEQRRRSFSWISRKTQLLKQVITDPYLLGYMVIKVLWIDLVQRNKVWLNTDLFVMFLNDYFFTDFSLGHLLVRPSSISIEDEVRFLDSYLHNRAVRLDQNINEYGLEFMLYHLKYTSVRPSYQNYSEELDKTLQIEWRKRSLRGLHYQTPDFVKSRTIPRVLAAPATVKIDLEGNFEAKFDDRCPPMIGPALEAGQPAFGGVVEGLGSVEAVILLPQHGRNELKILLCVFLDKGLVATFDPELQEFNNPSDAETCDAMASYLAIESFAQQVIDERVLLEGTKAGKILEAYTNESASRRMLELWGPWALIPEPNEEVRPDAMALLENSSFQEALQIDDKALRLLTKISMMPVDSEVTFQNNLGGNITDNSGNVLDQLWLDRLNAKSLEIFGFQLLNVINGKLTPSRI